MAVLFAARTFCAALFLLLRVTGYRFLFLAVLGGAQVLGLIGALIAPPWVAGASVLLNNLYVQPKLLAARDMAENVTSPQPEGDNNGEASIQAPLKTPSSNE
jgi:hypothetical protein